MVAEASGQLDGELIEREASTSEESGQCLVDAEVLDLGFQDLDRPPADVHGLLQLARFPILDGDQDEEPGVLVARIVLHELLDGAQGALGTTLDRVLEDLQQDPEIRTPTLGFASLDCARQPGQRFLHGPHSGLEILQIPVRGEEEHRQRLKRVRERLIIRATRWGAREGGLHATGNHPEDVAPL